MSLLERATYDTREEKRRDFIIGLIGFILMNVLLFGICSLIGNYVFDPMIPEEVPPFLWVIIVAINLIPYAVNIGLLIFFGIKRKWISFGALSAIGSSFAFVCLLLSFSEYGCFSL